MDFFVFILLPVCVIFMQCFLFSHFRRPSISYFYALLVITFKTFSISKWKCATREKKGTNVCSPLYVLQLCADMDKNKIMWKKVQRIIFFRPYKSSFETRQTLTCALNGTTTKRKAKKSFTKKMVIHDFQFSNACIFIKCAFCWENKKLSV